MSPGWWRDAMSATNAAIALLGSVLVFAAVMSWALGHALTGAWLIAGALACIAIVLVLMYRAAAAERDTLRIAADRPSLRFDDSRPMERAAS